MHTQTHPKSIARRAPNLLTPGTVAENARMGNCNLFNKNILFECLFPAVSSRSPPPLEVILEAFGCHLAALAASWGPPGDPLEAPLGPLWDPLGALWGLLGAHCVAFGSLWGACGCLWEP